MIDSVLAVIIIAQWGYGVYRERYWSKVTEKLIDKLMSRNYHEYKVAEQVGVEKLPQGKPMEDVEDMNQHVNEINQMMGLV